MKTPLILLILFALFAHARAAENSITFSIRANDEVVEFSPPHRLAFFKKGKIEKRCTLGLGGDDFFLSHDENTVILGKNRYIESVKLLTCDPDTSLRPRQIPIASTLTDINLAKKLYVAVNVVATAPQFLCVATVGALGSTKNLVNLPGADIQGRSDDEKLETAFECPERSMISSDGRYVSVMPDVDCSESSYPGVWDIRSNAKVIFSNENLSEQEINERCRALFF